MTSRPISLDFTSTSTTPWKAAPTPRLFEAATPWKNTSSEKIWKSRDQKKDSRQLQSVDLQDGWWWLTANNFKSTTLRKNSKPPTKSPPWILEEATTSKINYFRWRLKIDGASNGNSFSLDPWRGICSKAPTSQTLTTTSCRSKIGQSTLALLLLSIYWTYSCFNIPKSNCNPITGRLRQEPAH